MNRVAIRRLLTYCRHVSKHVGIFQVEPIPLRLRTEHSCIVQNQHSSSDSSKNGSTMENLHTFLQSYYASQTHGVLSVEHVCKKFCQMYRALSDSEKLSILCHIAENYGVNRDSVVNLAQQVISAKGRGEAIMLRVEERLRSTLLARYQTLFNDIGRIEGGVKFLADMRADILHLLATVSTTDQNRPHLQALQLCLKELLSLWFTVGFLKLERITWHSSCDMLQKISDYEAVHPVRNWADLKRRVGSYRRCFVFTHSSMQREPIVVLHVALTNKISSTIHSIIGSPSYSAGSSVNTDTDTGLVDGPEDPEKITTAIFYSITSTQKGLQGVDLGNYLIKKVVGELQLEWPKMTQFSSMSPIPGFREWLIGEINRNIMAFKEGARESQQTNILFNHEQENLCRIAKIQPSNLKILEQFKELVNSHTWTKNEELALCLKEILMRLCARYLYLEKKRGYALNSVANFHLQNGAVMWRLNWKADLSLRGVSNSCGMMVNYRYYLDDTVKNSQQYMESHIINCSDQIKQLCSTMTNNAG